MKFATTVIAALSFAAAPLAASAQQQQLPEAPEVPGAGVAQTETANLPVLSTIPAGAVVVGGVVILSGVIIGIAASSDDDNASSTTSTR